jgi:hypothetical protein
MSCSKNLTRSRLFQEPFARGISRPPEVGSHARPVEMHVHCQSRGMGIVSKTALFWTDFSQGHAIAAEFFGHVHEQIARIAQFFKILWKKRFSSS